MARGSSGYKNQYRGVGTAFQDQYHTAQQRAREGKEYRHKVQQRRQKEAKELYGELVVPDTGQTNFDADKRAMAMEWKKEANRLLQMKNNGEISAEEFEAQTAALTGNAKTFREGAENFKATIANYRENKDNISDATPTHILDALDTIDKNPDAVTTKNVNGVPHLVGETEEGEPISVPLADLQSGKGAWRFSVKENIGPQKDKIVKELGDLKQQFEIANGGFAEETLAWDALKGRAQEKVNDLIADETKLRAIAADEFGIDYEDFEELGADAVRQQVSAGLLQEIQNQTVPRQTQIRPQRAPQPTGGNTRDAANRATASRVSNNIQNSLNKYLSAGNELDQGALDEVIKHIGGNNVKGLKFEPASGGFLGFGKSDAAIVITDSKGKKQRIPADAQGLINNVLRLEFGTAVDESQNQIGGEVKPDDTNPLGI